MTTHSHSLMTSFRGITLSCHIGSARRDEQHLCQEGWRVGGCDVILRGGCGSGGREATENEWEGGGVWEAGGGWPRRTNRACFFDVRAHFHHETCVLPNPARIAEKMQYVAPCTSSRKSVGRPSSTASEIQWWVTLPARASPDARSYLGPPAPTLTAPLRLHPRPRRVH